MGFHRLCRLYTIRSQAQHQSITDTGHLLPHEYNDLKAIITNPAPSWRGQYSEREIRGCIFLGDGAEDV